MTRIVSLIAPRGLFDFTLKLVIVLVLGNLFALGVVYLMNGDYPSGLRNQLIETTIIALPFVIGFLWVISYLYDLQSRLVLLASTDVLTGLHNRRAFIDRLNQHLEGPADGFLFIADADHFKLINDSLGHDAGDRCLVAIADHLRRATGPRDVVARIGGEEFAVIASDPTEEAALALGSRIVETIDVDPPGTWIGADPVRVTLSVGGARIDDSLGATQLMSRVDACLYRAKRAGRARVCICDFDPHAPVLSVNAV